MGRHLLDTMPWAKPPSRAKPRSINKEELAAEVSKVNMMLNLTKFASPPGPWLAKVALPSVRQKPDFRDCYVIALQSIKIVYALTVIKTLFSIVTTC